MSNAGATRGTGATSSRNRGRAANVALWALRALRALLAPVFAMAGLAKLGGVPAMVEMFATIGVGQWFRYVVGALEISGAVGVLIPRLSGPAALGLVCLMAGATLTNLFVLGASPLLPIGLLVAGAVVARGGWPQTAALAGRTRR
jgi:uncharacterized membrane protein